MKIVCAGMPKTGTTSLAEALRILGFEVHDFPQHLMFHIDEYIEALCGNIPDFTAMYANVDAVTDSPACFFWKEIYQSFPDSKVVLMERDSAESWMVSLINNNAEAIRTNKSKPWLALIAMLTPTGRKMGRIMPLILSKMNAHPDEDQSAMQECYLEHNARVKATIPRDKLLVYNVKQGWDPLCAFLGVDVPDVPFPRLNVQGSGLTETYRLLSSKPLNELMIMSVLLAVAVAILIFGLI